LEALQFLRAEHRLDVQFRQLGVALDGAISVLLLAFAGRPDRNPMVDPGPEIRKTIRDDIFLAGIFLDSRKSAKFVALSTVPSQIGAIWLWNPIKAATGHTAVSLTVDHLGKE
jgi:hypothetical protein